MRSDYLSIDSYGAKAAGVRASGDSLGSKEDLRVCVCGGVRASGDSLGSKEDLRKTGGGCEGGGAWQDVRCVFA